MKSLFYKVHVVLFIFIMTIFAGNVTLFSQGAERGIIVTPSIVELEAEAGGNYDLEIGLENDTQTGDDIELETSLQYFTGSEKDGVPIITQNPPASDAQPALEFLDKSIALKKGEKKQSRVRVAIPNNSSPGGYFYALTYTTKQPETSPSTGKVLLRRSIVSLLFVNVKGDIQKEAAFEKFALQPNRIIDPMFDTLSIDYRIKVLGNTYIRPSGNIVIDSAGAAPINFPLNEDSNIVLPNTARSFTLEILPWWSEKTQNQEQKKLNWNLFGNKNITGTIVFADGLGDIKQAEITKTVFFFPWRLLAGLLLVIVSVLAFRFILKRRNK
jgi:hypothetical protein